MVKENLEEVNRRISEACRRAGRNREDVTLIAVSKTKPVSMLEEAYETGIRILVKIRFRSCVRSMRCFNRISAGT